MTTTEVRPTLMIIRGNSGSGKSTVATEIRRRYGRGCALVEQDYVRRVMLREHGGNAMNPVAPAFLSTMVREALGHGYHVVLEGILDSRGYGAVLREVIAAHGGPSVVFYLDVSFEETVRRHAGRPELAHVTAEQMRGWYQPLDLLDVPGERVIGESSSLEQTVTTILHLSGLAQAAALTPCPRRCPRCAQKRDQPEAVTSPSANALQDRTS